jgi:Rab GDP dissociation inhibitor
MVINQRSYVSFRYQKGEMLKSAKLAICKVPANDMEAFKSSFMGLFEKKRCMNFYKYVENIDHNDKKTWKDINIEIQPMKDVYKKYGLEPNTIDFLGHSVALHVDDKYLDRPAKNTIEKMNLYLDSIGRYGDSPFLEVKRRPPKMGKRFHAIGWQKGCKREGPTGCK